MIHTSDIEQIIKFKTKKILNIMFRNIINRPLCGRSETLG